MQCFLTVPLFLSSVECKEEVCWGQEEEQGLAYGCRKGCSRRPVGQAGGTSVAQSPRGVQVKQLPLVASLTSFSKASFSVPSFFACAISYLKPGL
jgi:hypothetical protein